MALLQAASACGRVARALAAVVVMSSCGGSSPSPDAPSSAPPGATTVSGTERLAWSQQGDVSSLRFVAYVDTDQVALDGAACIDAVPEAECSAPLPPLTDGVHTIAVAAVSTVSGGEGDRSQPITVQKVSARSVVGAASLPDARASTSEARLESTVTTSDGRVFTADVVARALDASMQLAATPDGRVIVAEADGRVHVVRPGEAERRAIALDARAWLDPPPIGPIGVALHPDFARNQFAYVSFLAHDGPHRTRLRILRMRDAGDTVGEPATIFETPIVAAPQASRVVSDRDTPAVAGGLSEAGPRLAFGPDGLLYLLLPPGIEFDDEPAASRPHASMLRLADDGRVPGVGPLSGIVSHPLGFAWHPATAAMWGIVSGRAGEAVVRTLIDAPSVGVQDFGRPVLRMTEGAGPLSAALAIQAEGTRALAQTFSDVVNLGTVGAVRLAVPVVLDGALHGFSGRVVDVVTSGSTIYLAMDVTGQPGVGADRSGVIVRLRSR